MTELYEVTVLLKDPSVDKVSAALRNLRNLGVLFPTQLSCQAIHGMASAHVVSQLEQARDVLVLSRRLEIVKAEVTRTVDAATALREIEEKEAARQEAEQKATLKVEESQPEEATAVEAPTEDLGEDLGKKKKPKKPSTKKKPAKKKPAKKAAPKKAKGQRKAKSQRKAKNKRKAANRSKRQNRRNR